jgi:hypothetical protein
MEELLLRQAQLGFGSKCRPEVITPAENKLSLVQELKDRCCDFLFVCDF